MFGYKDEFEYYRAVSIARIMDNIKVPTLGFGAMDDQVCNYQVSPFDKIKSKGSNVMMASSAHGAHANHISGTFNIELWYPEPFMEFINFIESKNTNSTSTAESSNSKTKTGEK